MSQYIPRPSHLLISVAGDTGGSVCGAEFCLDLGRDVHKECVEAPPDLLHAPQAKGGTTTSSGDRCRKMCYLESLILQTGVGWCTRNSVHS